MLRDRRTLIAVAVAVILAAAVAWAWFAPGTPRPAAVATRQSSPARRASEQQDGALPAAANVKLGSLETPKAEPADATRNPFRFERRAAAKSGAAGDFRPGPGAEAGGTGRPDRPDRSAARRRRFR